MKKTLEIIAEELLIQVMDGRSEAELELGNDVVAYAYADFEEDLGERHIELNDVRLVRYGANDKLYSNISEWIFNKMYKEIKEYNIDFLIKMEYE